MLVLDAHSNVKCLSSNLSTRNDSRNKQTNKEKNKIKQKKPKKKRERRGEKPSANHHNISKKFYPTQGGDLVGKTRCPIDRNPGCASLRWVRWCKATSIRYFRFGRNPGVIKGKAVRPPRPLVDRINRAGYTNLPDPKGSYTKCQISDVQCIVSGMGRYSYANAEHPRHFVPQSHAAVTANAATNPKAAAKRMQPGSQCGRQYNCYSQCDCL